MPGISERIDENHPHENELNETTDNEAAPEETATPREITQTDRINKFLLKSFLERMNNQIGEANGNGDNAEADADADEWAWDTIEAKWITNFISRR